MRNRTTSCLLCGNRPIEIHHVASQHLDITVPLCVAHHREVSARQYASKIPPEDVIHRLMTGICHLIDLGRAYGLSPITLARYLSSRYAADPRIRLHHDMDQGP